jgi:hypothetical protein
MNSAAHSPQAHPAVSGAADAVGARTLAQQAHPAPLDAWSAPYRSESFAEDLPSCAAPLPVKPKSRWHAVLLMTLPLALALLGSMLPVVDSLV